MFKFLNQYVENLNNRYNGNPMLFDFGLSPMKFPRNKKEIHTCMSGIIRTDPADTALSVPSRVLNQIIILPTGNVGLKNSVPQKLSKPWTTLEFVPAAAATIRWISTANPPSGMAPAGFVLRNVLTTDIP